MTVPTTGSATPSQKSGRRIPPITPSGTNARASPKFPSPSAPLIRLDPGVPSSRAFITRAPPPRSKTRTATAFEAFLLFFFFAKKIHYNARSLFITTDLPVLVLDALNSFANLEAAPTLAPARHLRRSSFLSLVLLVEEIRASHFATDINNSTLLRGLDPCGAHPTSKI